MDGCHGISKELCTQTHADTQVSGEDNVPFPSHNDTSCVRALCGQAGSFMIAKIPGRQAGMKGLVNITLVCGHQKLVSPVTQQVVVAPTSQSLTCDNDRDSPGSL